MISIVIPAYNEAHIIGENNQSVSPISDEVIVVDDDRTDKTSILSASVGARVIRIKNNQGYVNAIKESFANARGDMIVTFDADGEYPSDNIPHLISPIQQNTADLVPAHRNSIPRLSERILNNLANWTVWVGDSGSGFKAIRSNIARKLITNGVCICGVLTLEVLTAGRRLVELPITLNPITKPRKIDWFHLRQLFHILPWFLHRKQKPKSIIWRNI